MDSRPERTPLPPTVAAPTPWLWDIFCRVIDNFGDVGVCWRLAADLAGRGHTVRLWLDDPQALTWMAPGALEGHWPGVAVRAWGEASSPAVLNALTPAHVWVESFACELPAAFVAARAAAVALHAPATRPPVWINLEYLSAEAFVEHCHTLPSPVMVGPAKGWCKHFFYPGFTPATGGLLREPWVLERCSTMDNAQRSIFLHGLGLMNRGEAQVSLFCYDAAPVAALLAQLRAQSQPTHLLVTQGKARALVQEALAGVRDSRLRVSYLPWLSQVDFDTLLWTCDLNFVRGEDSLVRALWAGQPCVWQIYPQEDGAHRKKLEAFLNALDAPQAVRAWHAQWNGLGPWNQPEALVPTDAPLWRTWAATVQHRLGQQTDLTSQLLRFVAARHLASKT